MRVVVAVIVAVVACVQSVQADPILVNGSFELGPPIPTQDINILGGSTAITGWTVTGERIDYLGTPWDVSDGLRAIDLDGNDGIGGIAQTFATIVGQTYFVSFDLSGNPGDDAVRMVQVAVDGFSGEYAFDTSGQTPTDLIWHTIGFSFIADDSMATLSFLSLSPSRSSYGALIDNVSVSTVPEPSSLILLMSGVGGMVLKRWLHRGAHRVRSRT